MLGQDDLVVKNKILKKNEVLDDLQINDLKIIQNRNSYCFTSDSVLLSNFVQIGHKDKVVELCSGCGVISILVQTKYNPKNIVGIEIDDYLCDMANRSVVLNNIDNIKFVNDNLLNAKKILNNSVVDVVICNPPYFILNKNEVINDKYYKAKYETTTSLDEVLKTVSSILKFGGKFFMCYTPSRLQELLALSQKYYLILKKIQFVYQQNKEKPSTLALCMFVKNGQNGAKVLQLGFN